MLDTVNQLQITVGMSRLVYSCTQCQDNCTMNACSNHTNFALFWFCLCRFRTGFQPFANGFFNRGFSPFFNVGNQPYYSSAVVPFGNLGFQTGSFNRGFFPFNNLGFQTGGFNRGFNNAWPFNRFGTNVGFQTPNNFGYNYFRGFPSSFTNNFGFNPALFRGNTGFGVNTGFQAPWSYAQFGPRTTSYQNWQSLPAFQLQAFRPRTTFYQPLSRLVMFVIVLISLCFVSALPDMKWSIWLEWVCPETCCLQLTRLSSTKFWVSFWTRWVLLAPGTIWSQVLPLATLPCPLRYSLTSRRPTNPRILSHKSTIRQEQLDSSWSDQQVSIQCQVWTTGLISQPSNHRHHGQ